MDRLRFLHIPKTAGTTFEAVLRRQYAGRKVFTFSGDAKADRQRFSEMPEATRRDIVLFSGHAPITTGIDEADNAAIITFLREPVSRVKSFCQHVAEGKSPYLLRDFPPGNFNLDKFLDSGNVELSNLQARMLVGNVDVPDLFEQLSAEEARDKALDKLFGRVAYFGLQEFFDESLVLFSRKMNWRMPLYATRNRRNSGRQLQFEERHLWRIVELNAVDAELYRAAREKFIALLQGNEFDPAWLERFRRINGLAGSTIIPLLDQASGLTGRVRRWLG